MTGAAPPPGAAEPTSAGQGGFVAEVGDDVEAFIARVERLADGRASPFHDPGWLRAWYATLGRTEGRQPVLVAVRSLATGADVMLLPLASRRVAGLSIVGFADATVVDYQSPLLARDWHGADADARRLWLAVRQALRGHDVLRIGKMLGASLDEAGSVPNPLRQALPLLDCEMFGNESHAPGTWDEWQHALRPRARREFARAWRVFTRRSQARFERLTDPHEALLAFEQLEVQQSARQRELGRPYELDRPEYRAFYREVMRAGLAPGRAVMTVLRDGEHVAAAVFGVTNAERFIALRMSTGGDTWAACSPGRLLLERTASHLHEEQGVRWFDLGIGGYAYKSSFSMRPIPLFDAMAALSWRGQAFVAAWRLRRLLKRQGWLVGLVRRWRGTAPPE